MPKVKDVKKYSPQKRLGCGDHEFPKRLTKTGSKVQKVQQSSFKISAFNDVKTHGASPKAAVPL